MLSALKFNELEYHETNLDLPGSWVKALSAIGLKPLTYGFEAVMFTGTF